MSQTTLDWGRQNNECCLYPQKLTKQYITRKEQSYKWQAIKYQSGSPSWFLKRVWLEYLKSGVAKPVKQAFFLDPFAWLIKMAAFFFENQKTFRNFLFFEEELGKESKTKRDGGERERKTKRMRARVQFMISILRCFPWSWFTNCPPLSSLSR